MCHVEDGEVARVVGVLQEGLERRLLGYTTPSHTTKHHTAASRPLSALCPSRLLPVELSPDTPIWRTSVGASPLAPGAVPAVLDVSGHRQGLGAPRLRYLTQHLPRPHTASDGNRTSPGLTNRTLRGCCRDPLNRPQRDSERVKELRPSMWLLLDKLDQRTSISGLVNAPDSCPSH